VEQELVEVSAVAVPANREALALGIKTGVISRGAVQDALEILGDALKETARPNQAAWRWCRELRLAMSNGK
jgi:hypothetical protein